MTFNYDFKTLYWSKHKNSNIFTKENTTIVDDLLLQQIHCINSPLLKSICILPNLTFLTVFKCPQLIELPFLPMLKVLSIEMSNIIKIPTYPELIDIICCNSFSLTEINEQPKLINLNCSFCPLINKLPSSPNLESLDCEGCHLLTEIPEYPNIEYINCFRTFSTKEYNLELKSINTIKRKRFLRVII